MGMLLVEHDLSIVTAICDRVIAIDFGRMIFEGSVVDVVNDPLVRAAYLGELEESVVEVSKSPDAEPVAR